MPNNPLNAAFWASLIEPGDQHHYALRHVLGEDDARAWVCAHHPHPLPPEVGGTAEDWKKTWERWRTRLIPGQPERDLELLERLGGRLVTPTDTEWPEQLGELGSQQPVALWVIGHRLDVPSIALVGARGNTHYGGTHTRLLAQELVGHHLAITSGGAIGIDTHAHRGAQDAEGTTYALMAGGLGNPYPESNRQLFQHIFEQGGALISEVPPTWRPARWRFLARNRLIAAFAHATVVTEAGMRSGALATARKAMDLGRPVGALPGPLDSEMSKGCHALIRNGATLIRDGKDIIDMIGPLNCTEETLFDAPVDEDQGIDALGEDQRRVWDALPQRTGMGLTALARSAGISERDVLVALAALELRGYVRMGARGWERNAGRARSAKA